MATIYMPLLSEGTDVWRPVAATLIATNSYRVEGDVPEGEEWSFQPGAVVLCTWKTFSEGYDVGRSSVPLIEDRRPLGSDPHYVRADR